MKRSMEMWCHSPVCGHGIVSDPDLPYGDKMGPVVYHGLCGLTKCAKGVIQLKIQN